MGKFYVYKHTSPSGKVYIGITSRKKPEYRWNHGKAYCQNAHFSSAINKYGWDNFAHEIMFSGLDKDDACAKERELIAKYKSNDPLYGYNNSIGGENPAEGAKQSIDSVEKRRKALIGRKYPPEVGAAISAAKKGRPNGLEGRTGQKSAKSGMVLQIDETTKDVIATYYGFNEASEATGYAKTPIYEAARGIRKRAYGFLWEYQKRGGEYVAV